MAVETPIHDLCVCTIRFPRLNIYIYAGVFSDWLCRLTPVLVDALVEDEVLRECKAICALKPDFAAVVSEAEMIFDMVPDGLLSRSHLIQRMVFDIRHTFVRLSNVVGCRCSHFAC